MVDSEVPRIGTKMRLISSQNIRYEGHLYSVDTENKTVALSQVRFFGTEGRPAARSVAGHDDIYHVVVFKAADINDLSVVDISKGIAKEINDVSSDPAVLVVSKEYSRIPISMSENSSHSSSAAGFARPLPSLFGGDGYDYALLQNMFRNCNTVSAPVGQSQIHNFSLGTPMGDVNGKKPGIDFNGDYDFDEANRLFEKALNENKEELEEVKLDDSDSEGYSASGKEGDSERQEKKKKATAEESCYDKNSSFFDHISSWERDRMQGRSLVDWHAMRKTTEETFGDLYANGSDDFSSSYRRRPDEYFSERGNRRGRMYHDKDPSESGQYGSGEGF